MKVSEAFVNAIVEMRKYQKEYFWTRSPQALERSKLAEKRVDQMIQEQTQPNLFS